MPVIARRNGVPDQKWNVFRTSLERVPGVSAIPDSVPPLKVRLARVPSNQNTTSLLLNPGTPQSAPPVGHIQRYIVCESCY